ncbi:MAG: enoyl-CoA hydratase-related protein [Candidatus Promineifilaceae bacterium]
MNQGFSEGNIEATLNNGVLTLSLNRPQVHNALSPQLIEELTRLFGDISARDEVRIVVLTGSGRSFCAGADLASMRAAAEFDYDQNVAGGQAIFDLMLTVDSCPKPVIGRINGAAFGGGLGLICCCDIAVAVDRAKFAFSEVRLGVVPAVISPFVLRKIGSGHARRLFLTGERFDAAEAYHIGLVHQIVAEAELDEAVAAQVTMLLQGAPGAQTAVKELLSRVESLPLGDRRSYTAELLAGRRASVEGREGMSAFLQKRKPEWQN